MNSCLTQEEGGGSITMPVMDPVLTQTCCYQPCRGKEELLIRADAGNTLIHALARWSAVF